MKSINELMENISLSIDKMRDDENINKENLVIEFFAQNIYSKIEFLKKLDKEYHDSENLSKIMEIKDKLLSTTSNMLSRDIELKTFREVFDSTYKEFPQSEMEKNVEKSMELI